ncbi:hypothetical protein DH2020_013736 [Rehmannia glutinosa]|uniref:Transcription factor KAN4 n=1 Tax=Rehmannia glutinosa TaxID=99300 RepID=A0ABR0X341_REHGL
MRFFHQMSNNTTPYFTGGGGLDHHMPLLNLEASSSSQHRGRFSGFSSGYNQVHHHHHQHGHQGYNHSFGVGPTSNIEAAGSHNYHHHGGIMRSRFLPKMPAKRSMRAPRMRWTSTLHSRFVHAVELLGGHERQSDGSGEDDLSTIGSGEIGPGCGNSWIKEARILIDLCNKNLRITLPPPLHCGATRQVAARVGYKPMLVNRIASSDRCPFHENRVVAIL